MKLYISKNQSAISKNVVIESTESCNVACRNVIDHF